MFSIDEARDLLRKAELFSDDEEEGFRQLLVMNDVWGWACADAEEVPDEELPRVAELFYRYGWGGVLLWVSERNNGMRSEFQDINRFIDFAKAEEAIREKEPSGTKRAYLKQQYTLGTSG